MPQPVFDYPGMQYLGYCGEQCGSGFPPDPTGAVGVKYYVQAINKGFVVFDKVTGNYVADFTEDSLWSGQGNNTCASYPMGDPVVLYDQTADRWIMTNFAFTDLDSGPFYQCLAVSQSGDLANGGWWFYAIQTDQNPVPANTLNDYPSLRSGGLRLPVHGGQCIP